MKLFGASDLPRWTAIIVVLAALFSPELSGAEANAEDRSAAHTGGTDFIRDVAPILSKAGCNGGKCHGSFQGRGGFRR